MYTGSRAGDVVCFTSARSARNHAYVRTKDPHAATVEAEAKAASAEAAESVPTTTAAAGVAAASAAQKGKTSYTYHERHTTTQGCSPASCGEWCGQPLTVLVRALTTPTAERAPLLTHQPTTTATSTTTTITSGPLPSLPLLPPSQTLASSHPLPPSLPPRLTDASCVTSSTAPYTSSNSNHNNSGGSNSSSNNGNSSTNSSSTSISATISFSLHDPIQQAWFIASNDRPLMRLRDDPSRMWRQYNYAILPPTPQSTQLADIITALTCNDATTEALKAITPTAVETIAGKVEQRALHLLPAAEFSSRVQIPALWAGIVQSAHGAIGEPMGGRLLLQQYKALVAAPGEGEQVVHWDTPPSWPSHDPTSQSITCILYCTRTKSTALPRFPVAVMAWPPTEPADMRASAHLLESHNFDSVDVEKGTVLLMRQSTPHYGTRNQAASTPRVVLFDICSLKSAAASPYQDDYQYYKWMYMEDAFGATSGQRFTSYVENAEHHPLQRADDETQQAIRADAQTFIDALQQTVGIERKRKRGRPARQ